MTWVFVASVLSILLFCPRVLFNAFSLPQILALSLLSALGILLGVGQGLYPASTPSLIAFSFLIYMFLSVLWMNPVHNARKELGLQAPLVLLFLLGAVYVTEQNIKWIALASTIVLGLNSIYANAQTHGVDPFFPNEIKGGGPTTNAIGSIGNPNFLASFFAGTLWLGILAAITTWPVVSVIPMFALVVLYKTHSRAGQLGLFCSLIFFILLLSYYRILPHHEAVWTLTISELLLISIAVGTAFKDNWWEFFHKPIDPKGPQVWYASFRYRLCYWWAGWKLFKERPLFGWGMWSYRREVYRAQAEINEKYPWFLNQNRYITPQPRECHNDFLEHLVEFGLVGFGIFAAFLVSVYWTGFKYLGSAQGTEWWIMAVLLCNLTSVLVDAGFFFALRLPSTGLMFWLTCAMIVGLGGKEVVQLYSPSVVKGLLAGLLFVPFVYSCVWKRVMASYYFNKFRTRGDEREKGGSLLKALEYAPHDTILRTHACIAAMDWEPAIANMHAQMMADFFDGMTPLAVTLYNVGLTRARTQNIFDEAVIYLKNSHWMLPYFEPTLKLLNSPDGVSLRSRYKEGATMRIADEGVIWKVRALAKDIENLKKQLQDPSLQGIRRRNLEFQIQLADKEIQLTLVMEKKRLNIPDSWGYDVAQGAFFDPRTEKPNGVSDGQS